MRKKTPEAFRSACGAEIKRLRRKHNLTQHELASKLIFPVDLTTVARWESGRDNVSLFHFFAVCHALGETPNISAQWEAFLEVADAENP